MTVLIITLLFIWAVIATAMAWTFWAAWRENVSDLGHSYDRLDHALDTVDRATDELHGELGVTVFEELEDL